MSPKQLFKPLTLSTRVSFGLLLVRVIAGLAFILHGSGKIQHPMNWMGDNASVPGFFQLLAAMSEFGGGIAWVLGALTPLASFGIACTMTVATYTHAMVLHDPFVRKGPGTSFEPALGYFAIAVLLLLAGPGRFSVDKMLFGDKNGK